MVAEPSYDILGDFNSIKVEFQELGNNITQALKVYSSPVDSLRNDIANLSSHVSKLTQEQDQLRADLAWYMENANQISNLWLKPSLLGKLIGVAPKTIATYRYQGLFREESIRKVKRNQRVDYFYHRFNAIEDIKKIRPVNIKKK